MKKFKKLFAVILSLAMVLGMSMTAFAVDHKPVPGDSAEITVNGVKAGAEVTAYKIAEGQWNDNGFTGYKVVDGYSIQDLSKPTAKEITDLAQKVKNESIQGTVLDEENGVYKKTLEVGMYLILVTKNADKDMTVYNPMIVSVYYSIDKSGDFNDAIAGSVNAGDQFVVDRQNAYAKSMNPDITKKITSPLESADNVLGNDTAFGQAIGFEVGTDFPAYSDAYTKADFNIIDKLSAGLDLDADSIVVTVAGKEAVKDRDYTVVVEEATDGGKKTGTTLTISFTNTEENRYVIENKGAHIVLTYNASLNKNAGLNYDANTNTVKAEYTNNPNTDGKGETDEKRTYHYTFGIDAELGGNSGYTTGELFKTDENETEIVESEVKTTISNPLEGAEFKLTKANFNKDETEFDKKYTAVTGDAAWSLTGTSAADGRISFRGLDAGYYILEETKAPEGYSLDAQKHVVYIEAKYDQEGKLVEYSIMIDEKATSTYKATYTGNDIDKLVEITDKTDEATLIKNTKIASLPSTGGIGTTIFTIGGCLIMVVAAALFFASRRKSAK